MISKLDFDSKSISNFEFSPLGSKTYLFGEIPPKPQKHPLIPVLNFKKLEKNDDIIDIEEKKKELGSDYPEAKVHGMEKLVFGLPDSSNIQTALRDELKPGSVLRQGPKSQERLAELKLRKEMIVEMLNTTYVSDTSVENEESENSDL